jgi:fumarylacetoacetase
MIDFSRRTWVSGADSSEFSLQNLPFGIYSTASKSKRVGVAIGSQILDLAALVKASILNIPVGVLENSSLNDFIALGKSVTNQVRLDLADLLDANNKEFATRTDLAQFFDNMSEATMHMPVQVGDYTDFYSSRDHATNVGKMFRDPANALLPNWLHLPVGYHGRASSIVVSGASYHRPKGQTKPVETEPPVYGPSKRMDFELEVAFVIGKETQLGQSISTKQAEDHIFGLVLFNDLSARDIQQWEYVPLGPFLAKNFCSVISPWIVTIEALDSFRVEGEKQDPKVLPYLEFEGKKNYDIKLEVSLTPEIGEETIVSKSNFKYMYWNMCQQLAHHTVNGCNVRVGDMMASGTISGPEKHEFGSMLELAWKGTEPIPMKDGSTRVFMNDNDTCTMKGFAEKDGVKIGFGECVSKLLPAL